MNLQVILISKNQKCVPAIEIKLCPDGAIVIYWQDYWIRRLTNCLNQLLTQEIKRKVISNPCATFIY